MNPAIIVLAVQRLTQLVVEDEITRPWREAVERWSDGHEEGSLRERLAYIPTCAACASVWAAGVILVLDRTRLGRPLVRILAASGASLIVKAGIERLES